MFAPFQNLYWPDFYVLLLERHTAGNDVEEHLLPRRLPVLRLLPLDGVAAPSDLDAWLHHPLRLLLLLKLHGSPQDRGGGKGLSTLNKGEKVWWIDELIKQTLHSKFDIYNDWFRFWSRVSGRRQVLVSAFGFVR